MSDGRRPDEREAMRLGWGFAAAVLVAAAWPASALCEAQGTTASPTAPEPEAPVERSIEDLNLIGAAVTMPPFSDTVLGVGSGFRRALLRHGMALRVNVVPRYSQNLLDGPAPSGQQVYIGHRPTFISGVFTADLRQLGLRQAQLNVPPRPAGRGARSARTACRPKGAWRGGSRVVPDGCANETAPRLRRSRHRTETGRIMRLRRRGA